MVTCSDIPNKAENIKNIAIRLSLNKRKASSPSVSASDCDGLLTKRHCGNVKQYANSNKPKTPDTKNCIYVYWNLLAFSIKVKKNEPLSKAAQLTNHIVAMKPTVPNTRIGGKSFTVSSPWSLRMVNAVVFDKAKVGI